MQGLGSRLRGLFRTSRKGRKRRIVIVTPPSSYSQHHPVVPMMPLGPTYVAASLEEADYEVRIVDLTFVFQQSFDVRAVRKAVLGLEPDVVGLSAFTSTLPSAYKLATAIEEETKEVPMIIGGPHTSALPQRTLEECPAFDAAIVGEGEYTFRDILHLFTCEEMPKDFSKIRGVLIRHGSSFLGDPNPVYVDSLDTLPFPARHLLDMGMYIRHSYNEKAKKYPIATIVTSRGCPHSCLFCARSNSGKRYRSRSPRNVVQELDLLRKYGFNEVQIVDDNFTAEKQRVLELCRLIRAEGLDMSFALPNGIRADSVNEEVLSEMYTSGFYSIAFGVESGDDGVLKATRKGITAAQIMEAVRTAKKIGFYVSLFAIIGLPGSTMESEERTLRLIRESGADSATASVCTPYPGSPLWDQVHDRLTDVSWERYNESDVSNPIYLPDGLTPEQVQLWLKEAEKTA